MASLLFCFFAFLLFCFFAFLLFCFFAFLLFCFFAFLLFCEKLMPLGKGRVFVKKAKKVECKAGKRGKVLT